MFDKKKMSGWQRHNCCYAQIYIATHVGNVFMFMWMCVLVRLYYICQTIHSMERYVVRAVVMVFVFLFTVPFDCVYVRMCCVYVQLH